MKKFITITKVIQPNPASVIFALCNLDSETFKNVQRQEHEYTGSIEHRHSAIKDIPVEDLSKNAKQALFEIANKQLTNGVMSNTNGNSN